MVEAVNHKGDYHCDEQIFHVCSLTEHKPDAASLTRQAVGGGGSRRFKFSPVTALTTRTCRQPAVTGITKATTASRPTVASRVSDRAASSRTARTVNTRRSSVAPVAGHRGHGKCTRVGIGQTASPAVGSTSGTHSIENCLPTRTRNGQAALGVATSAATAPLSAEIATPAAATASAPHL